MSFSEYGRYADQVRTQQARYDNTLNSLQSSMRSNRSRLQRAESQYAAQTQRVERERRAEVADRDTYWDREIASKKKQLDQKSAVVEKEIDAQIERVREEKKKAEERQAAIDAQTERVREEKQKAEERRAAIALPHQYKPSLSTGSYGGYMLRKFPENSAPRKIASFAHHEHVHAEHYHDDDEKMEQEEEGEETQQKAEEDDLLYQQLYAEHKKVDEKCELVFKPECNVIGCCNQPEVDPKLLKGDMYICKVHRVEMADRFKQSGLKGEAVDDMLDKLGSMSDAELLQYGEQMVADDYFLKNYTQAQQQRLEIAKKLATMKQNSSEYWTLKLAHKRLQKCCDFLVMIRKLCNPIWSWVCNVAKSVVKAVGEVIHVICHCIGLCNCGARYKGGRSRSSKRREYEKENNRKINEAMALIAELSSEILDKERMKNECMKKEKDEQKEYDDLTDVIRDNENKKNECVKKQKAANKKYDELTDEIKDTEKKRNECIDDMEDAQKIYDEEEAELQDKLKLTEWTNAKQAEWSNKIKDKEDARKTSLEREKKIHDDDLKATAMKQDKKIQDAAKKADHAIEKENERWKQQKVDFAAALNSINDDMEKAKNNAAAIDADIRKAEAELQNAGNGPLDMEKMQAMVTALKGLEDKRHENEMKMKQMEDDKKNKEDEQKKKEDEHDKEIKRLEQNKKDRLQNLRESKEDTMKDLRRRKKDALKRINDQFDQQIKDLRHDRDAEEKRLQRERDDIQSQLTEHQTTGRRKLQQFKDDMQTKQQQYERELQDARDRREEAIREQERLKREKLQYEHEQKVARLKREHAKKEQERLKKEREKYEREQHEAEFERAIARAEVLCRRTSSGRVALYVVWDRRKGLRWKYSMVDPEVNDEYESYGNWRIAKFDGKRKSTSWSRIEFWTQSRYSMSYHYVNDQYSVDKYSDGTNVVVKL